MEIGKSEQKLLELSVFLARAEFLFSDVLVCSGQVGSKTTRRLIGQFDT
jgi:hypothetical protein